MLAAPPEGLRSRISRDERTADLKDRLKLIERQQCWRKRRGNEAPSDRCSVASQPSPRVAIRSMLPLVKVSISYVSRACCLQSYLILPRLEQRPVGARVAVRNRIGLAILLEKIPEQRDRTGRRLPIIFLRNQLSNIGRAAEAHQLVRSEQRPMLFRCSCDQDCSNAPSDALGNDRAGQFLEIPRDIPSEIRRLPDLVDVRMLETKCALKGTETILGIMQWPCFASDMTDEKVTCRGFAKQLCPRVKIERDVAHCGVARLALARNQ